MTNPRHMAAGLALVFAANLPAVTNASPNPAMVAVNSTPTRSAHMAGPLPLENTYFPAVNGWLAQMTGKTRARDAYNTELLQKMRESISKGGIHNFSAQNAEFVISVASGKGAVAVLLSQQVKDDAEFQQLKQSGDAHLHISDKAKWQGPGLYPVGALGAKLNARGGTEPVPNIDPYEFLNDTAKFSPQAGKQRKAAFVEMFGLGKGNPTMERIGGEHADRHAGQTQEFPNVQSAFSLKNVFSGLGGFLGGKGGNSPAPASQQPARDGDFPTAQPAPQPSGDGGSFPTAGGGTTPAQQAPVKPGCEAPSVVGSAAMAGIGALFTGKDPKAAAMAAGQSAMRQRPKPGCN